MTELSPVRPARVRERLARYRPAVRGIGLFAAGVCAAFLAVLLYGAVTPKTPPLTTRDVDESIAHAIASITPRPAYSADVYQVIQPSLVLIQSHSEANGKSDDGLGSGVVVDDTGSILTSLHVVANATSIQLTFADGTRSPARVLVRQPENDIAVLRATRPPAQLFPAVLGNPTSMRVGDEVYAVGNPFGLYSSMSSGVISGFNRSFRPENSNQRLEKLIQFDAAVNPGNSGGPLLNRNGQVIGIVTALLNPTEQEVFVGIGFAVPITTAGGAAGMPPV